MRLAGLLWPFWRMRQHYAEGLEWLTVALGLGGEQTAAWARAALGAGILARDLGQVAEGERRLEAGLRSSRAAGAPLLEAWALRDLGQLAVQQGRYEPAAGLLEAGLALAERTGDRRGVAAVLEEGRAVAWELGLLARAAQFEWQLGRVELARGNLELALPLLEALRLAAIDRDSPRGLAAALADLARVAHARRAAAEAATLLRESLRLRLEIAEPLGVVECLEALATANAPADPAGALRLLGAAGAALGPERAAAARAAGEALPLERAAAEMLGAPAPGG